MTDVNTKIEAVRRAKGILDAAERDLNMARQSVADAGHKVGQLRATFDAAVADLLKAISA